MALATPARASLPALSLRATQVALARQSLPDFIRHAWPIVEPGTPLSWNWHLDVLCDVLQSVTRGEIKRLILNLPPGSMKSFLVSVLWPAHEWATDPSLRYLTISYSDVNTIRDNRRLRSIVTSDWYRSWFGLQLVPDQQAKVRFDTTATGWRIASSVGGMGTGEHPDRLIIDDPMKADDARSETAIANVNSWFDRTISTRIARDPAIVVVMQRLHEEDLTGHLLAKGGWEHVRFPMRYSPKQWDSEGRECLWRPDPRDRRTQPGELLWPEQWPEEKVRQEELDLGPFGSAGQLGQRPVPEGGGLVKREWFEIVDAAPVNAVRCRGWDTAETDDGGDWTVGTKLSRTPDGTIYVEDNVRVQSTLIDSLMLQTARLDGPKCRIREGAGSGKAVIKARSILLAEYDYAASPETDDKVARFMPFRGQAEARNVKIVRGEWNHDYLSVICSFPVGKYDDDADSTSNAYNELVGLRTAKQRVSFTWKKRGGERGSEGQG